MDAAAFSSARTRRSLVWPVTWLTPGCCRLLLLLLLASGFVSHLYYLHHDCPIDLAGDEAQYWEWSRNLDLSYYSKGPLVAYIIAASTAIFGDTMPAVRYPALVLGAMTSLITYLLTLRLFRSDRLALGVVALYHVVPLFVAGSMLMTIDPPFYFCWGLATYLLACVMSADRTAPGADVPSGGVADGATSQSGTGPQSTAWDVHSRRTWLWLAIGIVAGIGFLAKYAMFLWFIPMLVVLAVDPPSRPWLRSRWPWIAIGVALLFTTQVIIWNARHDWVSFRHVMTQTGVSGGSFSVVNVLELVGGQIGILGPGVALFMIAGVVRAFLWRRHFSAGGSSAAMPGGHVRQIRFLAVFGVAFFAFTVIAALRAKVQMNWPAPAYVTLMILAGWFLSTRLRTKQAWRPWRPWFWFTIVFGLVMLPIAHDTQLLYPGVRWLNQHLVPLDEPWKQQVGWRKTVATLIPDEPLNAQKVDFTYKLKGWEEAGAALSQEVKTLGPGAFVLCHDYQQAAALAFYLDGQPATYTASSYYKKNRGRLTQYDVWPDRDLSPQSPLVGRNAVFVGQHDAPFPDLADAFERIEGVTLRKMKQIDGTWTDVLVQRALRIEIIRGGLQVRTFRYFKCYGFKGMSRPAEEKVSY